MVADAIEKVEALLLAAGSHGLSFLEYRDGPLHLRVVFDAEPTVARQPEEARASPQKAEPANADCITSPGVGFLRCAHPGGQTLPGEGDWIAAGAVVSLIQAGPLFQPVIAPRPGRLGRRLLAEGAGVGFGTALFELS